LLSFFVIFVSYFFVPELSTTQTGLVLYFMLLPCILVFFVCSGLSLYISYELSLLPIIYIIIKWGSYPERSLRALILLIYTRIFSLPLIAGLFIIYSFTSSFYFILVFTPSSYSLLLSFIIFLAFCVKLPIYGLHHWLPIAHVEAPTFGSIILAGVLLKLGGMGLIRFSSFLDFTLLKFTMVSYFIVFLVFSSLICCLQSDFKRLIAYSSVAHIIAVPLSLLSFTHLRLKTSIYLILFHGLSSPILFSLVGLIYLLGRSRQLTLIRGLVLVAPLLSFILIVSFLFTLSAPPYISFFSEVFFFVLTYSLTSYSLPFLLSFALLCLVYNLNWLSSFLFNSFSSLSSSFNLSYSFILPIFMCHLMSFLFLFSSSIL
jgi:NADH:ubiquinone oxidoreductase subunit 4 (subunit M)